MLNRSLPSASPDLILTGNERTLLDRLVKEKVPPRRKTLSEYVVKVARLGGY
jgi:hypothetical protein